MPKLKVTNRQEITYRLLVFGEMVVYDEIDGTLYDVTPDDQRFVMLRIGDGENAVASELILVVNWFEELKERVEN